jgi:hypothetical protein
MVKEDADSFFNWGGRTESQRVTPWLARFDELLATFGVHSKLTGSTLYSQMMFQPAEPLLFPPGRNDQGDGGRGGCQRRRFSQADWSNPRPIFR